MARMERRSNFKVLGVLLVVSCFLCAAPSASADTLVFTTDFVFSGSATSAQTGTVMATVTDIGANKVRIDFDTSGLKINTSFVGEWDFNLDKNLSLKDSNFAFAKVSGVTVGSTGVGEDAFKADGTGGHFDLQFNWPTPSGSRLGQADGNNKSSYTLTYSGAGTFNAQSFNTLNQEGTYYMATHIQGLGGSLGDSSWNADGDTPVPEPSAVVLLGGLLGGLGASGCRRFRARLVAV